MAFIVDRFRAMDLNSQVAVIRSKHAGARAEKEPNCERRKLICLVHSQ